MPRLSHFVPALHHALIKARANPPEELSASVEHQAREYLTGLKEGKVETSEYIFDDSLRCLKSTGRLYLLLSYCNVTYLMWEVLIQDMNSFKTCSFISYS